MSHAMVAYSEEEFCRTEALAMLARARAAALAGSAEWASVLAVSQQRR